MVSSWTDSLWLTKRKDGTFSVKPKKYVEGENWQLDSICNLRTPEQFAEGVLKAWEALGIEWGDGEVFDLLPTVATLDPNFAAKVEQYIKGNDEEGPDENGTKLSESGTVKLDALNESGNDHVDHNNANKSEDEEVEDEEEIIKCPRCGAVVITSDGESLYEQPACRHVRFVYDDYNSDFDYFDGRLERKIAKLRKDDDFSPTDWIYEQQECEVLQKVERGMACGPVGFATIVGFAKPPQRKRKRDD
jgi:uncharacterized C2H2 Zn-finger protein